MKKGKKDSVSGERQSQRRKGPVGAETGAHGLDKDDPRIDMGGNPHGLRFGYRT